MNVIETLLPGVLILQPKVWADARGFFMETYHLQRFREIGIDQPFVQDNHSRSAKGALRGLHFQEPHPQGKLIRCAGGVLYDVALDVRSGSPSFGKWVGVELSADNRKMLWVPPGFAHGFCALTDGADLLYKCTDFYHPENDYSILWNDSDLAIDWPVKAPSLSPKDAAAPRLKDAKVLPKYGG